MATKLRPFIPDNPSSSRDTMGGVPVASTSRDRGDVSDSTSMGGLAGRLTEKIRSAVGQLNFRRPSSGSGPTERFNPLRKVSGGGDMDARYVKEATQSCLEVIQLLADAKSLIEQSTFNHQSVLPKPYSSRGKSNVERLREKHNECTMKYLSLKKKVEGEKDSLASSVMPFFSDVHKMTREIKKIAYIEEQLNEIFEKELNKKKNDSSKFLAKKSQLIIQISKKLTCQRDILNYMCSHNRMLERTKQLHSVMDVSAMQADTKSRVNVMLDDIIQRKKSQVEYYEALLERQQLDVVTRNCDVKSRIKELEDGIDVIDSNLSDLKVNFTYLRDLENQWDIKKREVNILANKVQELKEFVTLNKAALIHYECDGSSNEELSHNEADSKGFSYVSNAGDHADSTSDDTETGESFSIEEYESPFETDDDSEELRCFQTSLIKQTIPRPTLRVPNASGDQSFVPACVRIDEGLPDHAYSAPVSQLLPLLEESEQSFEVIFAHD